ncbi:DEAD/DEAH box helicase family protein [Lolliginicoccus levis]|uniref:DEAD/DEAH box helicase family protein n=1 Tax=Lolliginicoccus levis TaxID=2919542 RepID=UPI00241FF3CA|nr:DEAD/DEAH box helicase family protein [Lolliginicoccus levis]
MDWRADEVTVPSGAKSRARANIAAIELLEVLDREGRHATRDEQATLAAWSGWGAIPKVFDARDESWRAEHDRLRELLDPRDHDRARASTLNAHYTDPAVVSAVWDALAAAGLDGGRVLEPGCGSGNFIGQRPAGVQMVGVELDPITARIAARLYPSAQVRNEGFETTRAPSGSFAATVGNVPFGSYTVHDPVHNPDRYPIHNHFILKSVDLTAPGGYIAVITSRYTLDAADERARRDIARNADLIAAYRLPTNAFDRVAGTSVVTDLLVLRRRATERDPAAPMPGWVATREIDVPRAENDTEAVPIRLNTYWQDHPDHVLGTPVASHGMHHRDDLRVIAGTAPLAEQLRAVLGTDIAAARGAGLGLDPAPATTSATMDTSAGLVLAGTATGEPDLYTLRHDPERDAIEQWDGTGWAALDRLPARKATEWRQLLGIRDVAQQLTFAQRDGQPPEVRQLLRGELNRRYDAYVERYGPINRFAWTRPSPVTQDRHDAKLARLETAWRERNRDEDGVPYQGAIPAEVLGEMDEKSWQPATATKRQAHLDGGLRDDPTFTILAALEDFDEDTGTATKTALFSRDVLTARQPRERADTPQEALALAAAGRETIQASDIARLLGCDTETAIERIAGLAYPDHRDPQAWVPAAAYLSGNVVAKLDEARALAATDPRYAPGAQALAAAQPERVTHDQIRIRPGTPWIDPSIIAAFATETFGLAAVTADHVGGEWSLEGRGNKHSVAMTETWGTGHRDCDALSLLAKLCNSKSIVVRRTPAEIAKDGGDELDMKGTFAAQAKAQKISEHFQSWLWADPVRRDQLENTYNRMFNNLRAPAHDGAHLDFPGLSDQFTPHYYQRDAVARIISEPTVLLDHVVGAGKTGTMFMGAMELKRLGLAQQPWIVVPNHLLEQFGREAKQWYPAAKVLMGTAATNPEGRRRLVAQSATGDWDMVIVAQSAFTAIKVDPARQRDYIERELAEMHEQLSATREDGTESTVKRIQNAINAAEEKLQRLTDQDRKDTGLRFEDSGCDYLFIDEAHGYKNLGRASNIAELNLADSAQKASDLDMKLGILRERRHDQAVAAGRDPSAESGRVATLATGTPVANSLAELWVMQRYLRPDLLAEAGVANVNDWGAAFTGTTTSIEVNATGTKLAPVTRVGMFVNLPELVRINEQFTDTVTREHVTAALPALEGGKRSIVTLSPSQEVRDFITDLAWRADNLDPRRPDLDNNLKIANDGRNVTLDPRLAGLPAPPMAAAPRRWPST